MKMRQRPVIELLEPRILYSADLGPVSAPALISPAAAEQRILDNHLEFAPQNGQSVQNAALEVAFVDTRTPDYALLVRDIAAQSGRALDVVMLSGERDGLRQIADALAGRENVAAVHIIAHGSDGVMQLGSSAVTADSLQRNPLQFEAWTKALTANADILLYGCDVAATAQGQLLADTLARLTGADVAASDNPTGDARLGGDWELEYATGPIEAQVAMSQGAQDAWAHLLADIVLTSYQPDFADMTTLYEIRGGSASDWGQTFSYNPGTTYTVNEIDLVLYKNTSPSGGNITVELRRVSDNFLEGSGTVSRQSLSTDKAWVAVSLTVPVTLQPSPAAPLYYIQIKGLGAGNIFVGVDDAGTYAGGDFTADAVSQSGKDMAFRLISSNKPVVDLNAGAVGQDETAAFTEQTPVLIAPVATLTDPDSADLASLTATLTARPDGDTAESLSLNAAAATAAGGAGLTVGYTEATGELSITGLAAVATYQTILQGIEYNNTSDAPDATERTVTVVADDGTDPSATRTSFITVTAVNDAPTVVSANTITYVENDAATALNPAIAVADVDSAGLAGATVTVSANYVNGEDVLSFTAVPATMGNITGSFDAASGTLTLTSAGNTATPAQFAAALSAVRYTNTSEDPSTAARTLSYVVNDGSADSATAATTTLNVTAVNDAPTVTSANTIAYVENDAATALNPAIAVADVDNVGLAGATVTVSANYVNGEDVLSFTAVPATMGNITGSFDAASGTLTLTSAGNTATPAQFAAALAAVRYTNTSEDPGTAARTLSYVVNDGTANSVSVATTTVNITAVNDAPTGADKTVTTNEDTAYTFSAADFGFSDVDAGDSLSAVRIDALPGAGTLKLSGAAVSAADVITAANIPNLRFEPGLNGNGSGYASFTFSVRDQSNAFDAAPNAITVDVTAVNDAPTVVSANTITYVENDPATALNPAIAVADVDSAGLAGATVTASANYVNGEDVLSFTAVPATMGNISGSFDAASGTLTLTSAGNTATPAQFAAALAAVRYTNTSEDPSTTARTVSYGVNDGAANSVTVATTTLNITAVNDAPTVTSANTITYTENDAATALNPGIAVTDPDSAGLASATVTVSANYVNGEDVLSFTAVPATMGNITGSFDAASGTLTLSSAGNTATPAQFAAALAAVRYTNTSEDPGTAARTLSYAVNDGSADSVTAATTTLNITAVNDAPTVVTPGGDAGAVDPAPSVSPTAPVAPALTTTIADQQQLVAIVAPAPAALAVIESAPSAVVVASSRTAATQQAQPLPASSRAAAPAPEVNLQERADIRTFAVEATAVPTVAAAADGGTYSRLRVAAQGVAAALGAETGVDLLTGVVKQVEVRVLDLFQSDERSGRAPGAAGLGSDLARLRDSLREQDEIQTRTVVTLTAGSLSVTFAYLIWLIRGGALAASMLSALPAWRLLDPLPILARGDDEEDESGDEDDPAIASFSEETGRVPPK